MDSGTVAHILRRVTTEKINVKELDLLRAERNLRKAKQFWEIRAREGSGAPDHPRLELAPARVPPRDRRDLICERSP